MTIIIGEVTHFLSLRAVFSLKLRIDEEHKE